MFQEKNGDARKRNTTLLNSVYNAKTTFQVVNATTAGASATHANLVASMGEYCKHVENLFPTWTVTLSHENVLQIQKLEEERKLTDLRREKAKEAFGREKALRDAVEKKRQDLAMAQLMEHNEEMERTTRRNELIETSRTVDDMLLAEAARSGEKARMRILEASGAEREEAVKEIRGILKKGQRGEGLEAMEEKVRDLEEEAGVRKKWLSSQLATAASTPGRIKLPMSPAKGSPVKDASPGKGSIVVGGSPVASPPRGAGVDLRAETSVNMSAMNETVVGKETDYDFRNSGGFWRGRGVDDKVRAFEAMKEYLGDLNKDYSFTPPASSTLTRIVSEAISNPSMPSASWTPDNIRAAVSDVAHCLRKELVGGEEIFVGIPSKILGAVKKHQNVQSQGFTKRRLDVNLSSVWSFMVSGWNEDVLKYFWSPMLVDPDRGEEGGTERRRRVVRKVTGVMKAAGEAGEREDAANVSRFSARSNFDEFGDEEVGKGGGKGGGGGDEEDDDDEFDF